MAEYGLNQIPCTQLDVKFENRSYITNKSGCVLNLYCESLKDEIVATPPDALLDPITRGHSVHLEDTGASIQASVWYKSSSDPESVAVLMPSCCDRCGPMAVGFRCSHFRFSDQGRGCVPIMIRCAPSHNKRSKHSVLVLRIEIFVNRQQDARIALGDIILPFKKNASRANPSHSEPLPSTPYVHHVPLVPPTIDSPQYPLSSPDSSGAETPSPETAPILDEIDWTVILNSAGTSTPFASDGDMTPPYEHSSPFDPYTSPVSDPISPIPTPTLPQPPTVALSQNTVDPQVIQYLMARKRKLQDELDEIEQQLSMAKRHQPFAADTDSYMSSYPPPMEEHAPLHYTSHDLASADDSSEAVSLFDTDNLIRSDAEAEADGFEYSAPVLNEDRSAPSRERAEVMTRRSSSSSSSSSFSLQQVPADSLTSPLAMAAPSTVSPRSSFSLGSVVTPARPAPVQPFQTQVAIPSATASAPPPPPPAAPFGAAAPPAPPVAAASYQVYQPVSSSSYMLSKSSSPSPPPPAPSSSSSSISDPRERKKRASLLESIHSGSSLKRVVDQTPPTTSGAESLVSITSVLSRRMATSSSDDDEDEEDSSWDDHLAEEKKKKKLADKSRYKEKEAVPAKLFKKAEEAKKDHAVGKPQSNAAARSAPKTGAPPARTGPLFSTLPARNTLAPVPAAAPVPAIGGGGAPVVRYQMPLKNTAGVPSGHRHGSANIRGNMVAKQKSGSGFRGGSMPQVKTEPGSPVLAKPPIIRMAVRPAQRQSDASPREKSSILTSLSSAFNNMKMALPGMSKPSQRADDAREHAAAVSLEESRDRIQRDLDLIEEELQTLTTLSASV
eukprot:TRINITY_DN8677_c0_g1_i1.p1 TRINITY_DN8677_c0_g1~~TRINITY_DN8677_c0_g1_i1.p1  ORF type:complete len:854 (-),score=181.35 TRINITY_DN8677_c0_g1_i1:7-2523(-)